MKKDFYKNVRQIDLLKTTNKVTDRKVDSIVAKSDHLIYYQYFFWNLDNAAWLSNHKFVMFIIKNLSSDNSLKASFPAYYLNKLSIIELSQQSIVEIVRKSKIVDPNAKWIMLDTIAKLNAKKIAILIRSIKNLIHKGIHEYENIANILKILIRTHNKGAAFQLFAHCTKPIREDYPKILGKEFKGIRNNSVKPILDDYEFKELIKSVIPVFKESYPIDAAKILKKNLIKCFEIESSVKGYKEDFSWIWRSAIEEHEQNYNSGKFNEVITSALKDILESIAKSNYKPFLNGILKEYIKSPYSIFRRLALHISRVNYEDNKQFVESIISDYRYFDDYKIKHEYSILLKDHFAKLSESIKKQYLVWIDNGPDIEIYKKYQKRQGNEPTQIGIKSYQDHWRYEKLWIIRDHIPERKQQIDEYQKQFSELKYPDLSSWHEETIGGYQSPLSLDQILSLREDVLVQLFKYPPNIPEDDRFQYFGFAKVFEESVKRNLIDKNIFVINPLLLINDEIAPIFIAHFFQGVSAAWKEKEIQWSESLTKLAQYIIGRKVETQKDIRGKYSRARFDLVALLEDIMRNRERNISADQLAALRDILIGVVGESDSTVAKELSKPNEDWSFVALNSTSGRVMHSLIQYSLRYAYDLRENINAGQSKLDPKVRETFERILTEEQRPSVLSVYGMYLANLWYLDAPWMKTKIDQLFPKDNPVIRKAVWDSYLLYNDLYKDIYESLKPEYERVVSELDPNNENDRGRGKLAEHISLIYLRGWDGFTEKKSITKLFIRKAPLLHRNQFIWRIGKALEDVKQNEFGLHEKVWECAKTYWQWRVDNIKPNQDVKNHQDELTTFFDWLEHSPETIEELFPLLKKTLKKRNPVVSDHNFTKYLADNSKAYPYLAIQLYHEYYGQSSENPRYYADQKQIGTVMENVLALKTVEGNKLVRDFANRLGELGLFEYKKYWEMSTKKGATING